MLNLVIRIAIWIAVLAALLLGARWLAGLEGQTTIEVAGYRIGGPTVFILGLFVALFAVIWVAVAAFRGVLGSVTDFFGFLQYRRHRRGLDAMSKSLIAVAEGDGRAALRHAETADRLLEDRTLTRLLCAQAAKLAGDESRAEALFEEMLESDDTRFLGLRGLLKQALEGGKSERALRFAERAQSERPKDHEVLGLLFDLQRTKGAWEEARGTVAAGVKAKQLTRDVSDRRLAVLHLSGAIDSERAGEREAALAAALEAVRLAPGLAPAAAMAARLLGAQGEDRKATRILVNAWRVGPTAEIAGEFARLAPDETPMERLVRFEKLFAVRKDDPETKLLQSELALAAERVELAREALGDLPDRAPSARAFALMAAIEQAQGADEAEVRGWLAKAASAPRGAQWVCDRCGTMAGVWSSACKACGGFDTLSWREVAGTETLSNGAMFPALAAPRPAAAERQDAAKPVTGEAEVDAPENGSDGPPAPKLIEGA